MANNSISWLKFTPPHPLDTSVSSHAENDTSDPTPSKDTQWDTLPLYLEAKALVAVIVYLDNFISVIQEGHTKW